MVHRSGRWLLLAALLSAARPGLAAEPPDDSLPLSDLASALSDPLYGSTRLSGAARRGQDVSAAPANAIVRTAGEILVHGYRTLGEVLNSMPGIHLRHDRSYEYAGVRGISRPGDFSSRLLVLVDGVRSNDGLYESGPVGLEFPVDVSMIDRVEFIPGPGSSMYGSSAVLGVVNVITRNPSQLPGLGGAIDLYPRSGRKLATSWGGELGPARVLLGASAERRPGRDLYYAEYDQPENNHGWAVGRDAEQSDKLFLKAKWSELVLMVAFSQRDKSIPTAAYDRTFNQPNDWTDETALLDLSYNHLLGAHGEVAAHLGLGSYRFDSHEPSGPAGELAYIREQDRARWISGELHHEWSGWAGHRVMTGFEFQANRRQSVHITQMGAPQASLGDFQLRSSRHAWFVHDEWRLAPRLSLTTGLRLDRRLDGAWTTTPSLAAIWSPSSDWTFKWLQGQAYREPNAIERYFAAPAEGGGKRTLSVEKLHSTELATLWRPAADWSLNLSLFRFRISDLVESAETADDSTAAYINRGSVRAKGAELEGTWVGRAGLQLRASASAQWAEDGTTGERLSDAPTRLAKLALTVPGPVEGARLGLNLQHVGERVTLGRGRAPAYTVLNTHLILAPPGQSWWLSFGAYNLADHRALDPGSPEQRQDTIRQDGREIRLQWGRRL